MLHIEQSSRRERSKSNTYRDTFPVSPESLKEWRRGWDEIALARDGPGRSFRTTTLNGKGPVWPPLDDVWKQWKWEQEGAFWAEHCRTEVVEAHGDHPPCNSKEPHVFWCYLQVTVLCRPATWSNHLSTQLMVSESAAVDQGLQSTEASQSPARATCSSQQESRDLSRPD